MWEWGYNQFVQVEADHITWGEKEGAVRFASGAACDQTFEHFLANGPWVDNVPPEVLEVVTTAVKAKLAARPPG